MLRGRGAWVLLGFVAEFMEVESFGRTREFLGRKWQWVLVQLIAATRDFVSQGFANVGGGAYPEQQPYATGTASKCR
jgi:hypothetical protein